MFPKSGFNNHRCLIGFNCISHIDAAQEKYDARFRCAGKKYGSSEIAFLKLLIASSCRNKFSDKRLPKLLCNSAEFGSSSIAVS